MTLRTSLTILSYSIIAFFAVYIIYLVLQYIISMYDKYKKDKESNLLNGIIIIYIEAKIVPNEYSQTGCQIKIYSVRFSDTNIPSEKWNTVNVSYPYGQQNSQKVYTIPTFILRKDELIGGTIILPIGDNLPNDQSRKYTKKMETAILKKAATIVREKEPCNKAKQSTRTLTNIEYNE